MMPMGLLQEPYCASPMVLKRIHVPGPQHLLSIGKEYLKKKKGLAFFTLEKKSWGLQIKLYEITVVLLEMCAEFINQVQKNKGQEGMQ